MLINENITLKQFVYLMLSCKFAKCELWTEIDYIRTHHSKKYLSHRIASKKMNLLYELGLGYNDSQRLIIMEGNQRVSKKNLSLLGQPIWTGKLEELSNEQNLWNKSVCCCFIKGLFTKKIQIIVKDELT